MSIHVHGSALLVRRFRALIQEALGDELGPLFELAEGSDSEAKFTKKPLNLPQGDNVIHGRFYQFLEPIVSDKSVRLDLQLAENSHTHYTGPARGAHFKFDLTDVEAIPPSVGAVFRVGAITRILCERHWFVTRAYEPWPGMTAEEWREVWYAPAVEYSLGQVLRVTGGLGFAASERFTELRGNFDSLLPIGTKEPIDVASETVALEPPVFYEASFIRTIPEHRSPGEIYLAYKYCTLPEGPYGVARVRAVPATPAEPRPMSERPHSEVF